MTRFVSALTLLAVCSCNCGGPSSGGSAGTSAGSAGSSAGPATTGTAGRSSAGSSGTNGGETTGGVGAASSSTTAGTSGSSGSTGGVPCAAEAIWVSGRCLSTTCTNQAIGVPCVLADGGASYCANGVCRGTSSGEGCGVTGFFCPTGATCTEGVCSTGCGSAPCPSGMSCIGNYYCVLSSCEPSTDDQPCLSGSGSGFCCAGSCIATSDTQNCGAGSRTCSSAEVCLGGTCVQAQDCSDAGPNAPCSLPGGGPGFCCQGNCLSPASGCGSVCGLSCTGCSQILACPAGQGCTVVGVCAPLDCQGIGDGLACSLPGILNFNNRGDSNLDPGRKFGPEANLTECCGGQCADLDFDPANCGACGVVCAAGAACQGGYCEPATDCASGANGSPCWLGATSGEGICCSGACIDPGSDPKNCIFCGGTCATGSVCGGGDVGCADGDGGTYFPRSAPCGLDSNGDTCDLDGGAQGVCCGIDCVDPGDISNCAQCGLGCLPCTGGCPAGTNCARIGQEKSGLPNESCLPGSCNPDALGSKCAFGPDSPGPLNFLGPGFTASAPFSSGNAGFCCATGCVDVAQDSNNCGLCGVVCPSGICGVGASGTARCLPAGPADDCLTSCGTGEVCAEGLCVDSWCDSLTDFCAAEDGSVGLCCPAVLGQIQAGAGACADLASDPQNCGGCGFRCPAGRTCVSGVCSGTPGDCGLGQIGRFCEQDGGPSFVCCPGVGCTNLAVDNSNCGTCGVSCSAGFNCTNGRCS